MAKITRRNFLKSASVAAAGMTVAGGISPMLAEKLRQEADSSLTGKLTFWGHADHPLDRIREAFLLKYPNVELEWTYADDHGAKFRTAMAAGTGAPDLYWAEADIVQLYGGLGALLETTDMIERVQDNLIAGKLAEAYVAPMGGYFGMPGDLSVSGVYYRTDIMEELGIEVPDDMLYDQFLDILRQIAAAGKNAVLYPEGGATVGFAYWSWFDAQYGGSGPVTCDNESVTINDEAGVAAIQLIKDIYETGSTLRADFWSPEYWNAISTDQLVLDLAPAWARGFWETNVDAGVLGKWRVVPLPRAVEGGPNTGVWGGATLISPASTENPELVKTFMEFAFGSMEGATAAAEWGIIPPYIPYLEGPFQELRTGLFGDQNIAEAYLSMAQNLSTEFCRTAAYGAALNELLVPQIDSMVTGGADIQATMDNVASQLEEILPDYQV